MSALVEQPLFPTLSPEELRALENVAQGECNRPATILRARIILHRATGFSPEETAAALGITTQKVGQWETRYRHHGIASLHDPNENGIVGRLRHKFASSALLRAVLHGFFTVAGFTLLAKAVSFFKDADIVRRFGVSDDLDAFALAFGLHAFVTGMLGGGIPSSFLPAYAVLQHNKGADRAERLAVQSAISQSLLLLGAGAVICLFGPQIVMLLAHGFPEAKQKLSLDLIRELLPFMFCFGLAQHLAMWLRANKMFMVAAAAPVLVPAAILLGLVMHGAPASISTLVTASNVGALLQLAVLCYVIQKRLPNERGWLRSCLHKMEPENRQVIVDSVPYIISSLVLGGAPIIDQGMAAQLESGSVTVLSYADKICGIILALTAAAAAETMFPFFSDVVARRNWPSLKRQMLHTIGVILAVALPLVAVLVWQAPLAVHLLFERGSFGPTDTARVADVLRCAALQIPFYIVSLLMSKVVVALQANWFTLANAAFSLGANFVFNLILMRYYGVAGIALSTAVVYALSSVLLSIYLMRTVKRLTAQDAERREPA